MLEHWCKNVLCVHYLPSPGHARHHGHVRDCVCGCDGAHAGGCGDPEQGKDEQISTLHYVSYLLSVTVLMFVLVIMATLLLVIMFMEHCKGRKSASENSSLQKYHLHSR